MWTTGKHCNADGADFQCLSLAEACPGPRRAAKRRNANRCQPRKLTNDTVEAVITGTLETRPKDATRWSTRTLAEASGLNQNAIATRRSSASSARSNAPSLRIEIYLGAERLRPAQKFQSCRVAPAASALSSALHFDRRFMVEPGGMLVGKDHGAPHSPRVFESLDELITAIDHNIEADNRNLKHYV